jgi:Lipoprotein amino terminal region
MFHRTASLLALCCLLVVACSQDRNRTSPWSQGSAYDYELHMASEAVADPNAPEKLFDFDLRAKLRVTPVEQTPEHTELRLEFSDVKLSTQQGDAHKARFERVARELQTPSTFTYEAGRQVSARLPKDAEAVTVGILRNLASQLQLPTQEAVLAGKQEGREVDATGHYQAKYQTREADGGDTLVVTREKHAYSDLIANDRVRRQLSSHGTSVPKIVESRTELTRKDGPIVSVTSKERIDLELMAGRGMTTRTDLALDLVAVTDATPVHQNIESQTVALAADAPYVHTSTTFDMDAAKIGDHTFDEVISTLEALAKAQEEVRLASQVNGAAAPDADVQRAETWAAGSLKHFTALSAMFRKNPDDVARAKALVLGGSRATAVILSAMSASGSEVSQLALLELMRDDRFLKQEVRDAAAFALLRAKAPTRGSAAALRDMLHDAKWREHAVFGLGTFVRRFGEAGQTELMKEFGDALVADLAVSDDSAARVQVLMGLSNAAYAPALPAVRPHLASTEAPLRAAAVQALRLMPVVDVEPLIVAATKDEELEVRMAAIEAVETREPSPTLMAAMTERLRSEPEARARLQVLGTIVAWSEAQPKLREAIERVAATDDDDVVRKSAKDALTTLAAR